MAAGYLTDRDPHLKAAPGGSGDAAVRASEDAVPGKRDYVLAQLG
jgi:hypothetical protein